MGNTHSQPEMPSVLINYPDWYTSGTIVRKLLETLS